MHEARAPKLAAAVTQFIAANVPMDLAHAEGIVAGRFCFVGHEEMLPQVNWRVRHVSHLWSYNLHYFDHGLELARAWRITGDARYADAFARLALGWVEATQDGAGDGWQPYPLSLRIVNWTYAIVLFGEALPTETRDKLLRSLHRQLGTLSRRLEWHILANHLQKNLHALFVGSLLFDDPAAKRWRALALRHLWRQLHEQVLPDGGHYERSPMYHAIALGDALEDLLLCDATGIAVPPDARERVERMAAALPLLARANGDLHLFNDAAQGIAPGVSELEALADLVLPGRPLAAPTGAWALPDTGYYGVRNADTGDALIVDCGEPGPGYQPGHAHCDLLSYELDFAGRPVIVDSGVHGYNGDEYREFVRSTRAHNTVMVAGAEQAELWSTFRMARRPIVLAAEAREDDAGWHFRGSYRPYHDRRAAVTRDIASAPGLLSVTDRIAGARGAMVESFIHLHPDFAAAMHDGRVVATAGGVTVTIEPFGVDDVTLLCGAKEPVQGWYCPEFGVAEPNPVVVLRVREHHGAPFGYRVTLTSTLRLST